MSKKTRMMGSVKALFASFWRKVGENDGGGCVVDIFGSGSDGWLSAVGVCDFFVVGLLVFGLLVCVVGSLFLW
jgi:hypothetical protein